MPLPEDPQTVETSKSILEAFKGIFGSHPGIRPAHAKGVLLTGHFIPSPAASALSSAPHFNNLPSTPILARLSSSTGIPSLPDTSPLGQPRGLAIRFQLPPSAVPDPSAPDGILQRRVHTDIIAHAVDAFPASTAEEALSFFTAVRTGTLDATYLASRPAAAAFVTAPKPFPASFATERFFAVSAFILVSAAGEETAVRYRVVPVRGTKYLSDEEVNAKSGEYLFDALANELPVVYKLLAQVADLAKGDVTGDCMAKWPEEEREVVELGSIVLDTVLDKEESERLGKEVIFDPIPRGIEGVKASDDPLLELRAGVYLMSGRERRAA